MDLFQTIIETYPELTELDFAPFTGKISLRNDADDFGDYIEKWEYNKPLPKGLKIGK